MKIRVYIDRSDKEQILEVDSIREIVSKLRINLEEFIIVRNGELITDEAKLKDKDKIKFLSVISGG